MYLKSKICLHYVQSKQCLLNHCRSTPQMHFLVCCCVWTRFKSVYYISLCSKLPPLNEWHLFVSAAEPEPLESRASSPVWGDPLNGGPCCQVPPLSVSFAPLVIFGKWLLLVRGADHNKQERTEIPVTEPPSPCRQRARSPSRPPQHKDIMA